MSIELSALSLGETVAKRAAARWLEGHRTDAFRDHELTELIRERVPGLLPARDVERLFGAIADAVSRRLQPMLAGEFSGLPENERLAAVETVIDTLVKADIDDATLFGADADPRMLAAEVRRRVPDGPGRALLNDGASRLYDLLLDECCDDYVRILIALPPFVARAQSEELARFSRLESRVTEVLARLPARSLYAPQGTENDEEFRTEYLRLVIDALDEFELYGADASHRARARLSTGYVALNLSSEEARPMPADGPEWRFDLPGVKLMAPPRSTNVETILGRSPRTFVRADAGSGKTTLLRWLAITAARGGFTGGLTGWNGLVPFSHVEGRLPTPDELILPDGSAISGHMPDAWIDRLFRDGRALLLVDGVDELPRDRRPIARRWLINLVHAYPRLPIVVTSRPTAAGRGWLADAGFAGTAIEPMRRERIREFVTHWHETLRVAGGAVSGDDLAACERGLQQRLDAAPHLRNLATNPLLAALLCAVNLDRSGNLPRDRMELYHAALEMLISRRDTERGLTTEIDLEYNDKRELLADLAYRLSLYGYTELRRADAERWVADHLAAMPRVQADAGAVFEHLLTRCGVLREPVLGRVDFVHRSFQEYLAAWVFAEQDHIDYLVQRAHRDTWRQTVIMTAGHARPTDRVRLFTGILDRADTDKRHSRKLRLLAAGCLESAGYIPDEPLRERLDQCLASLVPPRTDDEARALAALGPSILRHLSPTPATLTTSAAAMTIHTAGLIGGPAAQRLLTGYASDARYEIQSALLEAWKYFDPIDYAKTVLADAAMEDNLVFVIDDETRRLSALPHLNRMRRLFILTPGRSGLPLVSRFTELTNLQVQMVGDSDLRPLRNMPNLTEVWLTGGGTLDDIAPLAELRALRRVALQDWQALPPLDEWILSAELESLIVGPLPGDADLAVLLRFPRLRDLALRGFGTLTNIASLRALPLRFFTISGYEMEGGLDGFVSAVDELAWLWLTDCDWLTDLRPLTRLDALRSVLLTNCRNTTKLAPLAELAKLSHLSLDRSLVGDIAFLVRCQALTKVTLDRCPNLTDMRPLRELRALRDLSLLGNRPGLDLSPLAGMRGLTIRLYEGQIVLGTERLGRGVKIERLAAPADYDPYAPATV